jgi:hypothetical protein
MKTRIFRIGIMTLIMVLGAAVVGFAATYDNASIAGAMDPVWTTAGNMVGGGWGKLGGLLIALGGIAAREKIGNINMAVAIAIGTLLPMAPGIMDKAFTLTF